MSKQDDPRTVYADIIDLPYPHPQHPDPIKHPRMSLYNRAAQFAPFAALSGYEDIVAENDGRWKDSTPKILCIYFLHAEIHPL